jgi:hypothetical protein
MGKNALGFFIGIFLQSDFTQNGREEMAIAIEVKSSVEESNLAPRTFRLKPFSVS